MINSYKGRTADGLEELYFLRNYVYSLSEDDIAEDKQSVEMLCELL